MSGNSGRILVCGCDVMPQDGLCARGFRMGEKCNGEVPCTATEYVPLEEHERVVRERDDFERRLQEEQDEAELKRLAVKGQQEAFEREAAVLRRALGNAVRGGWGGWDKPEKWLEQAAAELGREKG